MFESDLSSDTKAILLLCGGLGQPRSLPPKPLTVSEYNKIAKWLLQHNLRPEDLFSSTCIDKLQLYSHDIGIEPERIISLLSRGGALAISVDIWTNKGIWVVSRADEDYPERLKTRLKSNAPPILYGSGSKELLSMGGLAIVGSRNINDDGLWFSNRIAITCAMQGIHIISGGARGVDNEAMTAAIDEGGKVIGVLANNLSRSVVSKKFRDALREEKLVLISSFEPEAGFNVGNAMARNKYIYALSDWALVVNTTLNKGGTWTGAIENIKKGWVPLFIHSGNKLSIGNKQLIAQGGIEMPEKVKNNENLTGWLDKETKKSFKANNRKQVNQLSLL